MTDLTARSSPPAPNIARSLGCLVLLCSVSGPSVAQCQYEVTAIIQAPPCPFVGPPSISGFGLNDDGVVVGQYDDCEGDNHAYVWDGTSFMTIDFPWPDFRSDASDINNNGLIVGSIDIDDDGFAQFAFVNDGAQIINLGTMPGGNFSEGHAINSANQIVGFWGNFTTGPIHAFLWEDGVMVDLSAELETISSRAFDINDAGAITGWRQIGKSQDPIAFIWLDGEYISLGPIPGGHTSEGRAINSRCDVVGSGLLTTSDETLQARAFLWSDGRLADLGILPEMFHSAATDIDDLGRIVGRSWVPVSRGFVWVEGTMWELNDLVDSELIYNITNARSINDQGQIIAEATTPNGSAVVLLTPIGASPADLTGNCEVNFQDLLILLSEWSSSDSIADIDENGIVGFSDLLILLAEWS